MKYSEFATKIKELGLKADLIAFEDYVSVQCDGIDVALVSKKHIMVIDTDYKTWQELEVWKQKILFDNLAVLAKTPLEKREDEKKYNVVACRRKAGLKGSLEEVIEFYYRSAGGRLRLNIADYNRDENQQWTMEQIKDWGLENYERIEVKD